MPSRDRILNRGASPLLRLGPDSPLRRRVLGNGARARYGAAAGGLSLPTSIDYAAYEFGSASNTRDANDRIETLFDLTENGNDLTAAAPLGGNRIEVINDANFGGDVGVFSQLTQQVLTRTTFVQGELSQPHTIYTVMEDDAVSGSFRYITNGLTVAGGKVYGGSGFMRIYSNSGGVITSGLTSIPRLVVGVFTNTLSELYANNDVVTATATGGVGNIGMDGVALGGTSAASSTSNIWDGKIGAVYICTGAHDQATRVEVAEYVESVWTNLTVTKS